MELIKTNPRLRPTDHLLTEAKWKVIDEAARLGFCAVMGPNCDVIEWDMDETTRPIAHKDVALTIRQVAVDIFDVDAAGPLSIHIECAARKVAEVMPRDCRKARLMVTMWEKRRAVYLFKVMAQEAS